MDEAGFGPAHAIASGYTHGLAVAAFLAMVGAAIAAIMIDRRTFDRRTMPAHGDKPARLPAALFEGAL